ncbi:hypothetical protein C0585_01900 [Candidatus Woesearchaeota archaeon]|nr:MAG: hypothetical protein C0585_01900 [Candidatus Woesearchaeota archaeon]
MNIIKLYMLNFLTSLHFFGAVTVPFFLYWGGLNFKQIFFLQAIYSIAVFLFEIPTGVLADKYSRKLSIILGTICYATAMIIFAFSTNYYFYIFSELIGAFGFTLMSGADSAIFYDSLKDKSLEKDARYYYSRRSIAGSFGQIVGLISGGVVAGSKFLPYPQMIPMTFLLTGIVFVVSMVVAMTLKEPPRKEKVKHPLKESIEGFKYIFKNKHLFIFSLNFLLISSVTFFMFWFYQKLAENIGIPLTYYGVLGASFSIFSIIVLLRIKKLEELFGIRNLITFTAVVPGILFISLIFIKGYFLLIPIILIPVMRIVRQPIFEDFMNKHIDSRRRATVLSSVNMLQRLVISVIYVIVGFLADISLNITFLVLGVIALIFSFISRIEAKHIGQT